MTYVLDEQNNIYIKFKRMIIYYTNQHPITTLTFSCIYMKLLEPLQIHEEVLTPKHATSTHLWLKNIHMHVRGSQHNRYEHQMSL